MPKAVNHSSCHDKHNHQQCDSNLGPLTPQSYTLTTWFTSEVKVNKEELKSKYRSGSMVFEMLGLGTLVGITVETVEALFKSSLKLVLARMSIFTG